MIVQLPQASLPVPQDPPVTVRVQAPRADLRDRDLQARDSVPQVRDSAPQARDRDRQVRDSVPQARVRDPQVSADPKACVTADLRAQRCRAPAAPALPQAEDLRRTREPALSRQPHSSRRKRQQEAAQEILPRMMMTMNSMSAYSHGTTMIRNKAN